MADQHEEPESVEIKNKPKKATDVQSKQPQNKSGYDPIDLLKAPAEPPAPKQTPSPSYGQFLGIMMGLVLIVLGLSVWLLVHNALPLLLVAIGAGVIAANTLFKPRT